MQKFNKNPKLSEEGKKELLKCRCNCKQKLDPYQLFDDNIEDISKSLAQILLICGISTTKCFNARSVIKRVFVYHEKLRSTCSPARENRLNRDDLLQALVIKCEMERIEALLGYAVIKRAFKAFFHGKCPHSISNPINDALSIHSQQGAWLHAAYRTARIFDNYKSAFFWAHKAYEKQIYLVYRDLYKRMQTRADPLLVPTCTCRGCCKREIVGAIKPGETVKEKTFKLDECENLPEECTYCGLQVPKLESEGRVKPPRPITNPELNIARCQTCNSPTLICECYIDPLTGEQFGECGQDSYKVKWYRVEDDQEAEDGEESTDWDNHHCPIDCKQSEDTDYCGVGSGNDGDDDDDDNVDDDDDVDDDDEYQSCEEIAEEEEQEHEVEKLEKYLNQLWAEEVAAKKNPKTFVPTIPSVQSACKCKAQKNQKSM